MYSFLFTYTVLFMKVCKVDLSFLMMAIHCQKKYKLYSCRYRRIEGELSMCVDRHGCPNFEGMFSPTFPDKIFTNSLNFTL